MLIRTLIVVLLTTTLMTCSQDNGKFTDEERSEQEAAWDAMMEVHDVVMPLRSDLIKAGRNLEDVVETVGEADTDFIMKAKTAADNLENADDAMMDWMAHISDNKLKHLRERYDDHAAVMSFLDKELIDIETVADDMKSSLSAAKVLIQEKSGN